MKGLPNKSVDMVLCDLPYGTTQCKWDTVIPFEQLWEQYKRLSKERTTIVLNSAQPFTSALIMSNIKYWKQNLIWEKNISSNFLNANRQHLLLHEDICVFAFYGTIYNPQFTEGKAYKNTRNGKDDSGDCYGKITARTNTINKGSRYPTSILKFDRETGQHPTQKPVSLMEYLIRTYSKEGDTVLDNCMGSGTTVIAAINTGRNAIGIEKDEKYFQIASERINERRVTCAKSS